MSVEATIVCDACSRVIVAARTAKEARQELKELGGMSRSPSDWCPRCVERSAQNVKRAQEARYART